MTSQQIRGDGFHLLMFLASCADRGAQPRDPACAPRGCGFILTGTLPTEDVQSQPDRKEASSFKPIKAFGQNRSFITHHKAGRSNMSETQIAALFPPAAVKTACRADGN